MADIQTRWVVNESLLQSYRSICISSQLFLLAVGAIVWTGQNADLMKLLAFLGGLMIFLWFRLVKSRHLIADYYKGATGLTRGQLGTLEILCSEADYVHRHSRREAANQLFGMGWTTHWRETRLYVDMLFPLLFAGIWFLLLVSSPNR